MNIGHRLVETSIRYPKAVILLMVVMTVVLGALIPAVKVDTDPENMLSKDEVVRVFHNQMKKLFDLNDIVVLGIINEKNHYGVFNPDSLQKIYELTEFAIKKIQVAQPETDQSPTGKLLARRYAALWQAMHGVHPPPPELHSAVIKRDVIAPSEVEYLWPKSPGEVEPRWLMRTPPKTQAEALDMLDKIVTDLDKPVPYVRNPMFYGTMVSEDHKALCIYLPLISKDVSHDVYVALRNKIATLQGDEQYYITGMPVAEDTFGVEMFKQMAISAPMAMAVIFLLMLVFFRKLVLVLSPMIVAMVSVICTMGLLIGTGNTVHIMSSMIPIFIMPIAVLDSIHILSEFFDRYQATRDRRATAVKVMDELFMPMLYTSLTSAAGFASLALTPIPPVQVFGIFVAIGVMKAWVLTVTFIPAYVMLLREKKLENFGSIHHQHEEPHGLLARFLAGLGRFTYRRAKPILAITLIAAAVAAYGISRININDNPVKWFTPSHPIRVADRQLNAHFAGTYLAYLVLKPEPDPQATKGLVDGLGRSFSPQAAAAIKATDYPRAKEVFAAILAQAREKAVPGTTAPALLAALDAYVKAQANQALEAEDDVEFTWEKAREAITEEMLLYSQPMKDPALLRYISGLQKALLKLKDGTLVGKTTSLADAIKMVNRDLWDGHRDRYRIPDTRRAVGTVIQQAQTGHPPRNKDIFHMVTRDFTRASVWVQLRSGDNRDMQEVVKAVGNYFKAHTPPMAVSYSYSEAEHKANKAQEAGWFGLTYINVEWQGKMVNGMVRAFLGSFLVVFLMMTVLFRSALWGILSMIPLTVTIALIYGLVGLLGIDYNMPIAILSSLTLGLAVDFAIHFLARSRRIVAEIGSWNEATATVFGEPARAITRNVIVISVGFLPLLFAPLVPYKTVGVFLATILTVSGVGTLIILPALVRLLQKRLFVERTRPLACYCGTCIMAGIAVVGLVAVNIFQYLTVGISRLTWASLALLPLVLLACYLVSRHHKCATRLPLEDTQNG